MTSAGTSEPHLHAVDLKQSFQIGKARIEVLKDISLQVASGETVFLCGASGAGKTTLLYTLAGLERPKSGRVSFEGADIYSLSSDRLAELRNRRMGFVFQSYFLLPELTALENVARAHRSRRDRVGDRACGLRGARRQDGQPSAASDRRVAGGLW